MPHPMLSHFGLTYTGRRRQVMAALGRAAKAIDDAAPDGEAKDRAMHRLVSAKDLAMHAIPAAAPVETAPITDPRNLPAVRSAGDDPPDPS